MNRQCGPGIAGCIGIKSRDKANQRTGIEKQRVAGGKATGVGIKGGQIFPAAAHVDLPGSKTGFIVSREGNTGKRAGAIRVAEVGSKQGIKGRLTSRAAIFGGGEGGATGKGGRIVGGLKRDIDHGSCNTCATTTLGTRIRVRIAVIEDHFNLFNNAIGQGLVIGVERQVAQHRVDCGTCGIGVKANMEDAGVTATVSAHTVIHNGRHRRTQIGNHRTIVENTLARGGCVGTTDADTVDTTAHKIKVVGVGASLIPDNQRGAVKIILTVGKQLDFRGEGCQGALVKHDGRTLGIGNTFRKGGGIAIQIPQDRRIIHRQNRS